MNNAKRISWDVEEFHLGTSRQSLKRGQADLIVQGDERYTLVCYCDEKEDGDLKRVDITSALASCPKGHLSVPLMTAAGGGPRVYRFTPGVLNQD